MTRNIDMVPTSFCNTLITLRVETPLHVHLRQGQIHGLFRAAVALQRAGVKTTRAHLRHLKGDLAQAGEHRFGFVTIGVVHALGRSFVRCGLQVLGTLNAGGFVDQNSQGFASALKAVDKQTGIRLMQRVVGIVKLGSLGHGEYILSVSL